MGHGRRKGGLKSAQKRPSQVAQRACAPCDDLGLGDCTAAGTGLDSRHGTRATKWIRVRRRPRAAECDAAAPAQRRRGAPAEETAVPAAGRGDACCLHGILTGETIRAGDKRRARPLRVWS